MKTVYLLALPILYLMSSCGNTAEKKMQSEYEGLQIQEGVVNADSFTKLRIQFAKTYPSYSKSARIIYESADYVARTNAEEAGNLFRYFYDTYKDSSRASDALFNAAFLLENTSPNISIDLYKKFINSYPEDPRTVEAKQNLPFVGKDAEYIMEMLKQTGKLELENEAAKVEGSTN
jgi:hypothetical protein